MGVWGSLEILVTGLEGNKSVKQNQTFAQFPKIQFTCKCGPNQVEHRQSRAPGFVLSTYRCSLPPSYHPYPRVNLSAISALKV